MDSEYKLIPVEILDNPKKSKIFGEAQHRIFEKLKITKPLKMEPVIRHEMAVQTDTQTMERGVGPDVPMEEAPAVADAGTQSYVAQFHRPPGPTLLRDLIPKRHAAAGRARIEIIEETLECMDNPDYCWEMLNYCLTNTESRPSPWMAETMIKVIPHMEHIAEKKRRFFSEAWLTHIFKHDINKAVLPQRFADQQFAI